MKTSSKVHVRLGPAQAPPPTQSGRLGPHTGRLLLELPVTDLTKPRAGCWNGRVKWNQSGLDTFLGVPVVRAFHRKGSGTSDHPYRDASGLTIQCKAPCLVGTTSIVVAFDVYFDDGWTWSGGGKLGGIFIGDGAASGGNHTADGASHRIMWQTDGGAISYLYLPAGVPQPNPDLQKSKGFGLGLHHALFKGIFKKGQWNRVEIGVKLNGFDAAGRPAGDGVAALTINGVTGVVRNVNWAAHPGMKISGFDYASFFGGPDPAVTDSVHYVRNFAVHEWR